MKSMEKVVAEKERRQSLKGGTKKPTQNPLSGLHSHFPVCEDFHTEALKIKAMKALHLILGRIVDFLRDGRAFVLRSHLPTHYPQTYTDEWKEYLGASPRTTWHYLLIVLFRCARELRLVLAQDLIRVLILEDLGVLNKILKVLRPTGHTWGGIDDVLSPSISAQCRNCSYIEHQIGYYGGVNSSDDEDDPRRQMPENCQDCKVAKHLSIQVVSYYEQQSSSIYNPEAPGPSGPIQLQTRAYAGQSQYKGKLVIPNFSNVILLEVLKFRETMKIKVVWFLRSLCRTGCALASNWESKDLLTFRTIKSILDEEDVRSQIDSYLSHQQSAFDDLKQSNYEEVYCQFCFAKPIKVPDSTNYPIQKFKYSDVIPDEAADISQSSLAFYLSLDSFYSHQVCCDQNLRVETLTYDGLNNQSNQLNSGNHDSQANPYIPNSLDSQDNQDNQSNHSNQDNRGSRDDETYYRRQRQDEQYVHQRTIDAILKEYQSLSWSCDRKTLLKELDDFGGSKRRDRALIKEAVESEKSDGEYEQQVLSQLITFEDEHLLFGR